MLTRLKKFWKKNKRTLVPVSIGGILTIYFQWQTNQIANRSYGLSITPRLSVATDFRGTHVGSTKARVDEVVCVPITIFNNSNAYALNVEFDVLMSYTKDKEISLNEYLRSHSQPVPRRDRLEPGGKWEFSSDEFCLSVINDAVNAYGTGREECKVEINLVWKDVRRNAHQLVHLTRLVYARPVETFSGYFWFQPVATYESLDDVLGWWQVKQRWGLPVSF